MKLKKLLQYTFILLLAVCFTACSDNSSGPEAEEDAPEIPDITAQAQPDISFFENNSSQASVSNSLIEAVELFKKEVQPLATGVSSQANAYAAASTSVISSAAFSGLFGSLVIGVQEASGVEPTFEDGVYEWTYSANENGITGTYRLTAEVGNSSTEWNLFLSFDDGETSIDNINIISGTVQNYGNSGRWEFRLPAEENQSSSVLLFSSDWTNTSDTESNIVFNVYDGEGGTSPNVEIIFDENGAEHLMTFDELLESGTGVELEVFWNTDTSIGYIFTPDGDPPKQCWDGSLQDIACSDVGL